LEDLQTNPKSQLNDRERIRDFQRKLYQKAKQEKTFRFYILYDKVRLPHFLREAYRRCKAKGGCAGVDGITFGDIEAYGVERYIGEIITELSTRKYKPQPVLRVLIPKGSGEEKRPLGIPVIKDRIIQMAVKLVIEPIFEADFEESSYGFRPCRSAQDAVKAIKRNLQAGEGEVFDADLSSYFDTIPHKELMELIGIRISDRNILHLIKMWLKTPVIENNRPKGGKKNKIGTPQGGVISPLLANIYLHMLDRSVSKGKGVFQRHGIKIVRYADDFVLMGKKIPYEVIECLKRLLADMKLGLNEKKSRLVCANNSPFNFLGYKFSLDDDLYGRRWRRYWNVEPSKKSQVKVRDKIRDYMKHNGHKAPEMVANELNTIIRGWINYFTIKGVTYPNKAKRDLRYYLSCKLMKFYKRKSQRKCKLYNQGAFKFLVSKYGLIDPTKYALNC